MSNPSINLEELSPAEKRALLAELLRRDGASAAPGHAARGNGNGNGAAAPSAPAADERPPHPYEEYVNPYVGQLLRNVGMDKRYVRGEGCHLFDERGRRYLDFTAAYGALPFGFNPPEIWDAVKSVASLMEPSFIQPSALEAAGELGRRLIEVAPPGMRYATFVNSGAEAVEVAIKLARAATGRMGIVSTENSFHGKTLGALSATGRTIYQKSFGAPAPGFARIPYGSLGALEEALAAGGGETAAFIVEPIQGEGGIRTPPEGYLRGARELCSRHGVLLIFDEVQTGLGRTGRLFACEHEGVSPDIMTLAKALGGGLVPAGAVLCTEQAYTEEFATKHTSTFAGNTLSCRVGLRSLELLTRDDQALVRAVADNGRYLRAGLEEIAARHPELIKSVRGRGYILGVEFTAEAGSFARPCLMESMAVQETLALALCSYMLNAERVRLAPTLFGARVLRIEPPLVATRDDCRSFLEAFGRAVGVLASCHTERLFAHLVGREESVGASVALPAARRSVARPSADAREARWGFIVHPLGLQSYIDMDEGLGAFPPAQLQSLIDRLNDSRMDDIEESILIGTCHLTSATGRTAYGEFIGITHTADELMNMSGAEAAEKVRGAVRLARRRGAQIVGLGGFSSVVTQNGLLADDLGVPVTTGNSYTVACAVEALKSAAVMLDEPLARAGLAIVGATGSIGRAAALLLCEEAGRLMLVGNPDHPQHSLARLREVAAAIVRHLADCGREGKSFVPGSLAAALDEGGYLRDAEDARAAGDALDALRERGLLKIVIDSDDSLREVDYIITATSSTKTIITPDNLKPGAVVCDISRPSNVSQSVRAGRPDVLVLDGGVVRLPGAETLGVNFGLGRGLTYACMAETMMMALEHDFRSGSLGAGLDEHLIRHTQTLAGRHGFRIGELHSDGRVLARDDWARIAAIRARTRPPE